MIFIEYPKCSTCKKAKINYNDRHILEETPTYDELNTWINKYNLEVKKLFNTSGMKYKALNLKDKLNTLSLEEKIKLLSSDGMLIKRPLLVSEDNILIGFKEKEWDKYLKGE